MNRKAVVMLSGGLDSILALKLMQAQGIDVIAATFLSPFSDITPEDVDASNPAVRVAQENHVPLKVLAKGMDYLRVVEHPKHGVGRAINPCIDCRIYMLRRVRERLDEWGAGFVVTGEVLGQRPMSQHAQAMRLIERESDLEGLLLRPLCARLLPPTEPERLGIVDRDKLLDIQGRSRKRQMELADQLGVTDYPSPAGGCLLTEPTIAARVRDVFMHIPDYSVTDIRLVGTGRHFRLNERVKVIVGRNHAENLVLDQVKHPRMTRFFLDHDLPGPTALAFGELTDTDRVEVGRIVTRFAKKVKGDTISVVFERDGKRASFLVTDRIPEDRLDSYRLLP